MQGLYKLGTSILHSSISHAYAWTNPNCHNLKRWDDESYSSFFMDKFSFLQHSKVDVPVHWNRNASRLLQVIVEMKQ